MSEDLLGTIKKLDIEAKRLENTLMTFDLSNAEDNKLIDYGNGNKYVINRKMLDKLTLMKLNCLENNTFVLFDFHTLSFYDNYITELYRLIKNYKIKTKYGC